MTRSRLPFALHRALELLRHVQSRARCRSASVPLASIAAARDRRHDLHARHARERGRQLVRDPVGEIRVARIAADAHERQHHDATLRGRGAAAERARRSAPAIARPRAAPVTRSPQRRARAPRAATTRQSRSVRQRLRRRLRGAYAPLTIAGSSSDASSSVADLRTVGRIALQAAASPAPRAPAARRAARVQMCGGSSVIRAASSARGARPAKGGCAGEHLVRRDAERVDVGAMVDVGIGGGLLGRHVERRAERRAGVGERVPSRSPPRAPRRAERLGDAEVGDRGRAAGEQDVVRLDVAMHDAALVRVGERARDVLEDRDRLRAPGARPRVAMPRAQRSRPRRTA